MGQLIADLFITLDWYAPGEGAPAYFGYPYPINPSNLGELRS
jgi:hypothetical protein